MILAFLLWALTVPATGVAAGWMAHQLRPTGFGLGVDLLGGTLGAISGLFVADDLPFVRHLGHSNVVALVTAAFVVVAIRFFPRPVRPASAFVRIAQAVLVIAGAIAVLIGTWYPIRQVWVSPATVPRFVLREMGYIAIAVLCVTSYRSTAHWRGQ